MKRWLLFICLVHIPSASAGMVGIYIPTTLSVSTEEKALKADLASVNLEVVAFGKFSEFRSHNKTSSFEAKIVPSSYVEFGNEKECKPVLQFVKNGETEFQYRLIGIKESARAEVETATIAIVDELERQDLKKYVETIMGTKFKNIKTVSKVEDLFNMIFIGNADYILIDPENLEVERKKFTSKIYEIAKSRPVKYPLICATPAVEQKQLDALRHISNQAIKNLGFTGAKAI